MDQSTMFDDDESKLLEKMRRDWNVAIKGDGAICPCCDRSGKVYRIKLNQTYALGLRWIYLHGGTDGWVNVQDRGPRWLLKGKNYGMLTHWGLLESMGKRSGIWRATQKGKDFVDGRITQPMSAFIYDDRLWGYEDKEVTFRQCFKHTFDYDEMMSSRFDWTKIKKETK